MTSAINLAPIAELRRQGRFREAIDRLDQAVRAVPDAAAEAELLRLRHLAFDDGPLPPTNVRHPEIVGGEPALPLPEVAAAELTTDVLRAAMRSHGVLRVNGLVGPARAAELRAGIDRSLAACDASLAGAPLDETEPWFSPFAARSDRSYRWAPRRGWMRASGGVWTADSPRMFVSLVALLGETGIGALAEAYLGERPALSANKCNLRRTPPGECGDWHQDGAFLGAACSSLNFWLALSECGDDAPTLDVVPRRLAEVAPTGTEGARFEWSASPAVAETLAGDVGIVRPSFSAGDAMLFDHFFLHRTAARPDMVNERYAMETWLFGPSAYPEGQIPLVY